MGDFAQLRGKAAIITGASRGIGAAAAELFAQLGVRVVLAARSEAPMREIASRIAQTGGTAETFACDVSRFQDLESLVARCAELHGAVDIMVNNAAVIDPISMLADSDPSQWSAAADINYKGVYFGIRAVLPVMLRQGGGTIINVSSGAAHHALEGWSHYCSSKAAVYSLTQCTDLEYREQGINVLGLSPGTVDTHMQTAIRASGINRVSELDRSAHISPRDAAQAIAWLCTSDAQDLTGTDFSLNCAAARERVGLAAR